MDTFYQMTLDLALTPALTDGELPLNLVRYEKGPCPHENHYATMKFESKYRYQC